MRGREYPDTFILNVVDDMIERDLTMLDVENMYGMPHATIWWNIHHVLPSLDETRFDRVSVIIKRHIHRRKRGKEKL